MTNFQIYLHVVPKVILVSLPIIAAFLFVERYIQRRKARNEGVFRDDRRENDWR